MNCVPFPAAYATILPVATECFREAAAAVLTECILVKSPSHHLRLYEPPHKHIVNKRQERDVRTAKLKQSPSPARRLSLLRSQADE
jgi:hypothetical protein